MSQVGRENRESYKCEGETAKEEQESSVDQHTPECVSRDIRIQIYGWILCTFILSVLAAIGYFAICQHRSGQDVKVMYTNLTAFDKSFRLGGYNQSTLDANFSGCREKLCHIICRQAESIFSEVHDTVSSSRCKFTETLVIEYQDYPKGTLRNSWLPVAGSVHSVILSQSNITKIKSGTFNTQFFSHTFSLSWRRLNVSIVESGALLGLHSLSHLLIESELSSFDRAFFQPVQTTLTHLKLHTGCTISKTQSVFGISSLEKLAYIDLSYNHFTGPVTRATFRSTPNLKYVILKNANVTSIASDAFEEFVGKLLMLDLEGNPLITISATMIGALLAGSNQTFVNFAANNWGCDCNIQEHARVYVTYRSQYVKQVYCQNGCSFEGILLNKVDFQQLGCETVNPTAPTFGHSNINTELADGRSKEEDLLSRDGMSAGQSSNTSEVFQMRCLDSLDANFNLQSYEINISNSMPDSTSVDNNNAWKITSKTHKSHKRLSDSESNLIMPRFKQPPKTMDSLQFAPPTHEFSVVLLQNRSAKVSIANYLGSFPGHVIWFSDQMEDRDLTHEGKTVDYNCMAYTGPYMVVDELEDNTTYTFCLIPYREYAITPFNCLPLHVPSPRESEEVIWISKDKKQFTVGMLFLIFALSTFFGAVLAYFIIKSNPDLLEGSKNVLVVKKHNQTSYISTISESEFLNNSSIKKRPLKTSLCESGGSSSQSQFTTSVKSSECLSSLRSTCAKFEDDFVQVPFSDDEYEMPVPKYAEQYADFSKTYKLDTSTVSPHTPPPLPKRNSNISDSFNLVIHRFSKGN